MAETETTYYLWNINESWGNVGFYWTSISTMIQYLEDGYVGLINYKTTDDTAETYNEYHTVQDENMADPSLEDYLSLDEFDVLTISYASTEDTAFRERFGDDWYTLTEGSQMLSDAIGTYTQQMLSTTPTPELTNERIKYTRNNATLSSIDGSAGSGAMPTGTYTTTGASSEGGY